MLRIPDCGTRLLRYTTLSGIKNEGRPDTHFQQHKTSKLIPGVTSSNKHACKQTLEALPEMVQRSVAEAFFSYPTVSSSRRPTTGHRTPATYQALLDVISPLSEPGEMGSVPFRRWGISLWGLAGLLENCVFGRFGD